MTDDATPDPQTAWFADYAGLGHDEALARAESEGRAVRVLAPGSLMTMDWRPARLNVHLDDDGALDHLAPG